MSFGVTLRDEQLRDALQVLEAQERRDPPTILCRPTGAGKTIVASWLMDIWRKQGLHVLFMVERRALVFQTSDTLNACGVPHGVIMAGEPYYPHELVQVVSRDTLFERGLKRKSTFMPPGDVLVRDECHRGMANSDLEIYDCYPDAFHLGLSATPALTNGKPMNPPWARLIHNIRMQDLIDRGLLLGNVIYEPRTWDAGADRRMGGSQDFRLDEETAALVNLKNPIGNVVEDWRQYGENRPTFVFCTTIKHSQAVSEEFNRTGIPAKHIDCYSEVAERDETKAASLAGQIKVVTSCELMGYGVDWPHIGCCVHLRPCRHPVPWIQFCGRASRTWGTTTSEQRTGNSPAVPCALYPVGKRYAIQIDHVGNTRRLGWPEDCSGKWDLSTGKEQAAEVRKAADEVDLVKCECGALRRPGKACEGCGAEPKFYKPRAPEMQSGTLQPALRTVRTDHQRTWDNCLGVAIHRGASLGSAITHFRSTTGEWPGADLKKAPSFEHQKMNARDWYDKFHSRAARAASAACP